MNLRCPLRAHRFSATLTGIFFLCGCGRTPPPPPPPQPTLECSIQVTEHFKIIPEKLACQPGQRVHVRISNSPAVANTDLPHNLVFLQADTDVDAYGKATLAATVQTNYMPAAFMPQVFAYTSLIHSGDNAELTFTAPNKPGTYPIVCSFPGHCLIGMRADLIVQ